MKTEKLELPKMETVALYDFGGANAPMSTSTSTDNTGTCTTILTTTHLGRD